MKPFRCLHCRAALGQTDGTVLQVANCLFRLCVTIECVICGTVRKWKPVSAEQTPNPEPILTGTEIGARIAVSGDAFVLIGDRMGT